MRGEAPRAEDFLSNIRNGVIVGISSLLSVGVKKPECPEGAENYCYHSGYPDKFRHSELFPMSPGETVGRGG